MIITILFIYITISLIFLLLTPHDRNIHLRGCKIVILSGSNMYITKFRLDSLLSFLKTQTYKDEIYLCGAKLGSEMQSYLVKKGLENNIVIINSANTFEDAKILMKTVKDSNIKGLVLITSISHQKRAYNTFKRLFEIPIYNRPAFNEIFSLYSPFLPSGWLASLLNLHKEYKYRDIIKKSS